MFLYVHLAVCALVALGISHTRVYGASTVSPPDCNLEKYRCRLEFKLLDMKKNTSPEEMCQNINTYLKCLLNMNCPKEEGFEDKMISGARSFVNTKAPDCVLSVEQAGPGSSMATSTVLDCSAQLQQCYDARSEQFRQLNKPDVTCSVAKSYLSCVYGLQCPQAIDEREKVFMNTSMFLGFASPSCNLREHQQQLLSSETTETTPLDLTVTTFQDCQSQLQICRDMYEDKENQLTGASTACANAKDYLSCVNGLSCPQAETGRSQADRYVKSRLIFSSPNCDLLTKEQQTEMTTSGVLTTEMDCETKLEMCVETYEEAIVKLVDVDTYCRLAQEYMSCVSSLSCPAALDQRHLTVKHVKSLVFLLNLTDCNITGYDEHPETEVTGTSGVSSPPPTLTSEVIMELVTFRTHKTGSTGVTTESIGVTTESTGVTTESIGVTTESTGVTAESIDVTTESTGVTTESTGVTTESADVTTESTGVTTESAYVTTEDTKNVTTDMVPAMTTNNPQDSFCRSVISYCLNKVRYAERDLTGLSYVRRQECCTLTDTFDRCVYKSRCTLKQLFNAYRFLREIPFLAQNCVTLDLIPQGPGMSQCPALSDQTLSPLMYSLQARTSVIELDITTVVLTTLTKQPEQTTLNLSDSARGNTTLNTIAQTHSNTDTSGTDSTPDITSVESTPDMTSLEITPEVMTSSYGRTETTITPGSATVPVETIMDVNVVNLNVEMLEKTQVLLTWELSSQTKPSVLTGFIIMFKVVSEVRYQQHNLTSTDDDQGEFHAVLSLRQSKKHAIKVKPYSDRMLGKACHPIYIFVSGTPVHVSPGLSMSATPLASDTVLVSYTTVGSESLTSPMFYFMRDNKKQWTPLQKHMVAINHTQSMVVQGLREETDYKFLVKARLGTDQHTAVAFVTTPPSEAAAPLTLTKRSEAGFVYVTWSHWMLPDVHGYKVTIRYNLLDTQKSRLEVKYLSVGTARLRFGDSTDTVDSVKVEPFDSNGIRQGAGLICVIC